MRSQGNAFFFGTLADARHGFDDFYGVGAAGGFGGEHDGVAAIQNCIGDVKDFCACGDDVVDHGFHHLCSRDYTFIFITRTFDNKFLLAGQRFIADVLPKADEISRNLRPDQRLEIDGGIDPQTVGPAAENGADTFVAGFAIFGATDPVAAMARIREAAQVSGAAGGER